MRARIVFPGLRYLDPEQQRRWIAHCHRMAETTYALADWCDDLVMMAAYVALGAKWVLLADAPAAMTQGREPTASVDKDLAA